MSRCDPEVVPGCYETFRHFKSKDIFNYNSTNRIVIVFYNIFIAIKLQAGISALAQAIPIDVCTTNLYNKKDTPERVFFDKLCLNPL